MRKPPYWSKYKYDVFLANLQAAYLLNEQTGNVARDFSGNQINATITRGVDATAFADRQNTVRGNALNFGTDIYATMRTTRPLITTANFSIIMELMRTGNSQSRVIFDQATSPILNGAVEITFDSSNRIRLLISDQSLGFVVTRTITGPQLPLNEWKHFCVTYVNEQSVNFYLDGVKTTTTHSYEFVPPLNIAASIGGNNGLHAGIGLSSFVGLINHCYIANVALSDQEVIRLRDFPYVMYKSLDNMLF